MHKVDKNSGNSFQIQKFAQHEIVPGDKFELQPQIFYQICQTEFQQISQIDCNEIKLVSKNIGICKETVYQQVDYHAYLQSFSHPFQHIDNSFEFLLVYMWVHV